MTTSVDVCPDANLITQGYGCTPVLSEWLYPGCSSGRFHSGIDLGRTDGGWNLNRKPVHATRAGQVIKVGAATMGGYWVDTRVVLYFGDQSVTIRADDGHFLMYGHLDQADCTIGARVKPGDIIGLVGSKGNSTAPHLHFEVRTDGPYQPGPQPTIDPTSYLNALPVAMMDAMMLLRSSENGPDGNPLIYAWGACGTRHLSGAEYTAAKAAGIPEQPMAAAEIAKIPVAGATHASTGTVTGTLTIA